MKISPLGSFADLILRLFSFISLLLKTTWLFFPGILFVLFTVFCFWMLGQGKDILVAFTENESRTILSLNYTRIIFFLAIGFWVYVSWYSSRIIAYIKKSKQADALQEITGMDRKTAGEAYTTNKSFVDISAGFLDEAARSIGNACILVLELAVLQSPVLPSPLPSGVAWLIFFAAMIILFYVNKWIREKQATKPIFRKLFWILLIIFLTLVIISSLGFFPKISMHYLLGLLLLFHAVFIFYINLRRIEMEHDAAAVRAGVKKQDPQRRTLLQKLMDYFCIPRIESGYFRWFVYIGLAGLILYLLVINWLDFAQGIGPFPFIILAFGILLAFGNMVTAFSVRFKLNFHFLLLLLAFVLGLKETHRVRTVKLVNNTYNRYGERPRLDAYLRAWLNDRNVLDSTKKEYDIYFVMANGGASRSGYWTASVLGRMEDASLLHDSLDRFSDHVFCLSGTSGGGVGVATFFSLLRDKENHKKPLYCASAKAFLKQDYFTYTFARMLGPDFFNYIFHISSDKDRAAALESSFEEASLNYADSLYQVPFYDTMSKFTALDRAGHVYLPILYVNTTRMQDGNPGVVTNLMPDPGTFNERVDVLGLLRKNSDISLASGSILGARFPYLSPAGRIANNYFVDGGYFDNSGAGVVQETIRRIINLAKEDSIANGPGSMLYRQVRKLHFKVLHITNSPVDMGVSHFKRVAPIKNDLLSPILSIVGAYDMQTTVNDGRLINFINDINKFEYPNNRAGYLQIPLYKDNNEWKEDPLNKKRNEIEPAYAMNWFMSDTTLRRINKRLEEGHHRKLDSLIRTMNSK